MRELFFRSLKPWSQLWFLLLFCMISLSLFLSLGSSLVTSLFGFNLVENPGILNDFKQPYVVDAHKVLLLMQHIGVFILPALLFNQIFSLRKSSFIFWGERPVLNRLLLVVGLMLLALPVINYLLALNSRMSLPPFLHDMEQQIRAMENEASVYTEYLIGSGGSGALLVNLFIMAIVPAIGEEFFFRGILQKLAARISGNLHLSIWVTAAVFSAIHMQFYGFLPRMLLGALFGYLSVWMGSIWYAVLAHFINNAVSLLLAWSINQKMIPVEVDQVPSLTGYL
ncbi:MAG: CPBP family intramembrane glutamic endopeptidase, partial [Bacteroidota bacterium]